MSHQNSEDYEEYIEAIISVIEDPDIDVTDSERFFGAMQALKRMGKIDPSTAKAVKRSYFFKENEQKDESGNGTSQPQLNVKVGADFSHDDKAVISQMVIGKIQDQHDLEEIKEIKFECEALNLDPTVLIFFCAMWVQLGNPIVHSISDLSHEVSTARAPFFLNRVWRRNAQGVTDSFHSIIKNIQNLNKPVESRDKHIQKSMNQVFFLGIIDHLNF